MNWIAKTKSRLSGLVFADALWWPAGNVLIDDIGFSREEDWIGPIPAHKGSLIVYGADDLTKALRSVAQINSERVIWPGQGAKIVRRYLGLTGGIVIDAHRTAYRTSRPQVEVFQAAAGAMVIDDVVSSGATAREIVAKGRLVNASLSAWIVQCPRDGRLNVFRSVHAGLLLGGPGFVPCWTMSTFLRYPKRLQSYAELYAQNPAEFVDFWQAAVNLGLFDDTNYPS